MLRPTFDIIPSMAPVSHAVQVAQLKTLHLAEVDLRQWSDNHHHYGYHDDDDDKDDNYYGDDDDEKWQNLSSTRSCIEAAATIFKFVKKKEGR